MNSCPDGLSWVSSSVVGRVKQTIQYFWNTVRYFGERWWSGLGAELVVYVNNDMSSKLVTTHVFDIFKKFFSYKYLPRTCSLYVVVYIFFSSYIVIYMESIKETILLTSSFEKWTVSSGGCGGGEVSANVMVAVVGGGDATPEVGDSYARHPSRCYDRCFSCEFESYLFNT